MDLMVSGNKSEAKPNRGRENLLKMIWNEWLASSTSLPMCFKKNMATLASVHSVEIDK
jgi:hypothetical protein